MKTLFQEIFSRMPEAYGEAPGRVNLIGEHTDYNGGFVLPTAIPQRTHIILAPRDDMQVRLASKDLGAELQIAEYTLGQEERKLQWSDYVEGASWLLQQKSHALTGFDALIVSDVPIGAGLSSSAALLVALFRGLRRLFQLPIDDVQVALLSQTVENEFVGARVGIMDQMAASLADIGTALFLDTRHLTFERIPLPPDKMELFIINSGVKHSHVHGGYNTRRSECESAAQILGVPQLRDFNEVDLSQLGQLSEVLQKRARHVISENARVQKAVRALLAHDFEYFGQLMLESHASMRDDYEVSVPEIDFLVEEAASHQAVLGARLTGGGFGGSIVGLCRPGEALRIAQTVRASYREKFGREATILVPPAPPASAGASSQTGRTRERGAEASAQNS